MSAPVDATFVKAMRLDLERATREAQQLAIEINRDSARMAAGEIDTSSVANLATEVARLMQSVARRDALGQYHAYLADIEARPVTESP